ncbi:uncharacterized protein LOC129593841 [Paramacrobiotus metropolitanus]|uniref:uncharacterized protein LOC129593841 n=1 Tax=Paramacrobiotus metropolitanus TaxID=2943436 RepID=UPI00244582D5|nr:uncharacterized protein LOC129593841 [Paramacrobiotus metropolitanus]
MRFQCFVHHVAYELNVGCRVFARVGTDTVTFICAEMHGDVAGRSLLWNEGSLTEACQTYLDKQQFRNAGRNITRNCGTGATQLGVEETNITDLPHVVLACILYDLDIITRYLRINRVCALWKDLLLEPIADQHIVFDVYPLCFRGFFNADESARFAHKLIALLNTYPSQHTRSMTFTNDGKRHLHYKINFRQTVWNSAQLLQIKTFRLPVIVLKDYADVAEHEGQVFLDITRNAQTGHYECEQLSWLLSMSGSTVWLESGGESERRKMPAAHLNVLIPFLRFSCTETPAEQCRRFIAAVNDNCPAVGCDVYARVKRMHWRWVQTLYPDEWTGIREFLTLFSSVRFDGQPQCWNGVDLKEMDVSLLSPLSLHMLDKYLAD